MSLTDVIEWTWTLIAMFGFGVAVWALIDNYLDRAALSIASANGEAARIVDMNLRSARASFLLQAFFVVLGVGAILTPNNKATVVGSLFGIGFIVVAAANVRAIGLNQLERMRMRSGRAR